MTTDPTTHQALTDDEMAALTKWAVAFYRPEDLYAAIGRIVAARVAAARAEALREAIRMVEDVEAATIATIGREKGSRVAGLAQAALTLRAVVSREPGEGDTAQPHTKEENIAFRKAWDERVERGKAGSNDEDGESQ